MRRKNRTATALLFITLAACSGEDAVEHGTITLFLTDAPFDEAAAVVLLINRIEFKREGAPGSTARDVLAPQQIDLLQYQEGRSTILVDSVALPAGRYEWLKLVVSTAPNTRDTYMARTTGEECEMQVPAGAESGWRIDRPFTLSAGETRTLTIDVDLRKSIRDPVDISSYADQCAAGYVLQPTLRLVDNANAGAISGAVDSALVTDGCLPKVYVFSGTAIAPDDMEDVPATDVDPLQVASVRIVNGSTAYHYRAAFLPAGPYTAAFTCSDDDPARDDAVVFSSSQAVNVQRDLTSTADFLP